MLESERAKLKKAAEAGDALMRDPAVTAAFRRRILKLEKTLDELR